jgi:hypothetical protein
MYRTTLIAFAAVLLLQSGAIAQMSHRHASEAACDSPELRCASKVAPTFDATGRLWLAWMAGGRISVASSTNLGKDHSAPVQVSTDELTLDWGPDARPSIVVDNAMRIFVAFSTFKDKAFNGKVVYTQSTDEGKTFERPLPITSNTESQRFVATALDADGSLFAVWLDKRNRVEAKAANKPYEGAGLFFTWFKNGVATSSEASMAKDNTCECCRLGVAFAGAGRPAVVFRNIFDGGVRDHAVLTFDNPTSPGHLGRVSDDNWVINACPHHGPGLTISPAGTYHVTWFTSGSARKGLFYARSVDNGQTYSAPLPIGTHDGGASRPYVLALRQQAAVVWKEFDGNSSVVRLMTSSDDGASWSESRIVARTDDASDHPLLVSDGSRIFLSWMTKSDGYLFQPLGDAE